MGRDSGRHRDARADSGAGIGECRIYQAWEKCAAHLCHKHSRQKYDRSLAQNRGFAQNEWKGAHECQTDYEYADFGQKHRRRAEWRRGVPGGLYCRQAGHRAAGDVQADSDSAGGKYSRKHKRFDCLYSEDGHRKQVAQCAEKVWRHGAVSRWSAWGRGTVYQPQGAEWERRQQRIEERDGQRVQDGALLLDDQKVHQKEHWEHDCKNRHSPGAFSRSAVGTAAAVYTTGWVYREIPVWEKQGETAQRGAGAGGIFHSGIKDGVSATGKVWYYGQGGWGCTAVPVQDWRNEAWGRIPCAVQRDADYAAWAWQ